MTSRSAHFSSQELARVLSHYELGIIKQVRTLSAGNRRAPKVVIVSDNGKFMLKRRPRGKDNPNRVSFSHEVQQYLQKKKFPVAKIIPTKTNETVLHEGNHTYEIFEFITGRRYDGSAKETYDAGQKLASFHKFIFCVAMNVYSLCLFVLPFASFCFSCPFLDYQIAQGPVMGRCCYLVASLL